MAFKAVNWFLVTEIYDIFPFGLATLSSCVWSICTHHRFLVRSSKSWAQCQFANTAHSVVKCNRLVHMKAESTFAL